MKVNAMIPCAILIWAVARRSVCMWLSSLYAVASAVSVLVRPSPARCTTSMLLPYFTTSAVQIIYLVKSTRIIRVVRASRRLERSVACINGSHVLLQCGLAFFTMVLCSFCWSPKYKCFLALHIFTLIFNWF